MFSITDLKNARHRQLQNNGKCFLLFHTATENCLGNSQQRQEIFKTLRPTYDNRDLVVGVEIIIRPGKSGAPFSVGIKDFSSTKILPTGC